LAAYLAAILPAVFTAIGPRPLKIAALVVLCLGLLATASRGGWLAAAAGVFFILRRVAPRALPVFTLLLLAAAVAPWPPGDRLLAAFGGMDAAAASRVGIWREALAAWLSKPVAGWGMTPLSGVGHPHNFFLEMGARGGIIALAGFLPLFVTIARRLLSRRSMPARVAAAMAGFLALMVFGLGDTFLTQPSLAGIFWLNCGMILRERPIPNET
jgi:O-antigen ligase